MKNFSEFNISPRINHFVGEKITVTKLLNLQIKVLGFKVEPSRQKPGTECLTLQIIKSGEKRIVFTGSTVLIDQIKRVPDNGFPFSTTIKGDNDYYEFT